MTRTGISRIAAGFVIAASSMAIASTASAQDMTISDAECAEIMTQIGNETGTGNGGSTGAGTGGTGTGGTGTGGAGAGNGDFEGDFDDTLGTDPRTPPPIDPADPDTPAPGGNTNGGGGASGSVNLNANQGRYLTRPNVSSASVSYGSSQNSANRNNTVIYYRGSTNSSYQQNVVRDKPYTPGRSGPVQYVRGQPIALKNSSVRVSALSQGIVNAFDEMHLVASAMGYPAPLVTSGNDSSHSRNSKHFSNDAVDIRCNSANGMTKNKCISYVLSMKAALGSRYDVIYEDYGNSNSHIHVAFLG